MVNAMGKIEALNQLCLKRWAEQHAPRHPSKQQHARALPETAKVREDEVIGVLPIEVQHVRGKHFRVLCVCGRDAASIVRTFAATYPSNGRIINEHACEALAVGVASACNNEQNFAAESSFAVPDLTTKTSGGANYNGGQTIGGVKRRLAHRVLHAGIILHDAFWTRDFNAAQRARGTQIGFGECVGPFLLYQNRCRNSAELADGPGFGHVGKTIGAKIAKSASHWERVWQRKANHVALAAAKAAPDSTPSTSLTASDDDAASEASTVVASAPLMEPSPTAEFEQALPVSNKTNDDYPRVYCLPSHLKVLWECCSRLDGGFGGSGPAPVDIARGTRSKRWTRPPEAFFCEAPWRTAHIAA